MRPEDTQGTVASGGAQARNLCKTHAQGFCLFSYLLVIGVLAVVSPAVPL